MQEKKTSLKQSHSSWAREVFATTISTEPDCSKIPHTDLSGIKSTVDPEQETWTDKLFNSKKDVIQNPKLVIISGQNKSVREFEFSSENREFIFGNHPLADIHLDEPGVCRFHARIFYREGRFFLEDLGSEQGTFLNDIRIQPSVIHTLNAGSHIRIMAYQIHLYANSTVSRNGGSAIVENRSPEFMQPVKTEANPVCTRYIDAPEKISRWQPGITKLVVVDIIEETHDVKTFRLAGTIPLAFIYQPGQFITLILTIDGQRIRRSYSMSSTPSRPYTLDITVKRIEGGLVSNWLCNELKPGDTLTVKGPSGKFSFFQQAAEKLLFIGAGSGITPIMSMARWIMDTGADVDVKFMASFHSQQDVIFRKEFELLASRCHNIHSALTVSTGPVDEGWSGYAGRLNRALLTEFVPDIQSRHVYLCGPDAFSIAVRNMLKELDFPLSNLHLESFASGHVEQGKHIEALKKELHDNAKYHLALNKTGVIIPANDKFSILELVEMHGIEMDYSCRIGHCGECMVKCLQGKVEMGDEAEIDSADRDKGWVYGCCTYPRSDMVLDL